MRLSIAGAFGVFLAFFVPGLASSAPLAHIQARVVLEGQALGRSLANQEIFLGAWEDGSKIRADLLNPEGAPTRSAIVRKDLGKLYLIEHKDQAYQEMAYPPPPDVIDYGKIPVLSTLLRFGLFKKATVTLQEVSGTQLIKNYRCSGYKMDIAEGRNKINAEIWANTQITADKLFGLEPAVIVSLAPKDYQGLVRQVLEVYTKIEGFPVEASMKASATRLAGGSLGWELISYDRTKAPLGAYDPPKGYAVK